MSTLGLLIGLESSDGAVEWGTAETPPAGPWEWLPEATPWAPVPESDRAGPVAEALSSDFVCTWVGGGATSEAFATTVPIHAPTTGSLTNVPAGRASKTGSLCLRVQGALARRCLAVGSGAASNVVSNPRNAG